ncbi:MAG: cation diffusion facilitator family transporter [Bacteroidota bacterium]|nr:cation diffusion facilitator family transporter [Bacteroidota bacterium]
MPAAHEHKADVASRSFALGIALNTIFVTVEVAYGLAADSLVLIADAGHNASDIVVLLMAWGANTLARKTATERRTYGFRKATVMASLVSAVLLLVVLGGITREAVGRLIEPRPVQGMTVIAVAVIGVVINALTAALFLRERKSDLNIRAAFLHMAADAAVSLGVAAAGLVIILKGWLWVDPVVTLAVVAVVFAGTWDLLKDSVNYAMDAVPKHIDIAGIRNYLEGIDNVQSLHDLHVWPMSTREAALTVHLVVSNAMPDNEFLNGIHDTLRCRFGVGHATIQLEASGENGCPLDRRNCVS